MRDTHGLVFGAMTSTLHDMDWYFLRREESVGVKWVRA